MIWILPKAVARSNKKLKEAIGRYGRRKVASEVKEEDMSLGTSKGILEIAKFALYVTIPATLTYAVANDSQTLRKLMGFRSYVVYPPEGPRPPPPEELREARKNNIR